MPGTYNHSTNVAWPQKHEHTLGYARLYDGTVVSYYYRAMSHAKEFIALTDIGQVPMPPQLSSLLWRTR